MDHYAADAYAVVEHLDLRNAIHIGHSTGGGEVARYVAKYGEPQGRVAKAVLVCAVPPLMLKTDDNPGRSADRGFRRFPHRSRRQPRRSSTWTSPSGPFYGFNRDGAEVSRGRDRRTGGARA